MSSVPAGYKSLISAALVVISWAVNGDSGCGVDFCVVSIGMALLLEIASVDMMTEVQEMSSMERWPAESSIE